MQPGIHHKIILIIPTETILTIVLQQATITLGRGVPRLTVVTEAQLQLVQRVAPQGVAVRQEVVHQEEDNNHEENNT